MKVSTIFIANWKRAFARLQAIEYSRNPILARPWLFLFRWVVLYYCPFFYSPLQDRLHFALFPLDPVN